jgi:hypothetical protein
VRHGSVVAKPEQRYGVVVGRFNDLVTKLLLEGAKGAFAAHGAAMSNVEVRSAAGESCEGQCPLTQQLQLPAPSMPKARLCACTHSQGVCNTLATSSLTQLSCHTHQAH